MCLFPVTRTRTAQSNIKGTLNQMKTVSKNKSAFYSESLCSTGSGLCSLLSCFILITQHAEDADTNANNSPGPSSSLRILSNTNTEALPISFVPTAVIFLNDTPTDYAHSRNV